MLPRIPSMGLRRILHDATRAAHDRVERAARLDASPTRERYVHFLSGNHRVLQVLEPALRDARALAALGFDLASPRRLEALESDLAYLGVKRPRPLRMIQPDHDAAYLGCAYVLEGSALGARVLARRWAQPLGFAPGRGASYLEAGGEQTGARWSAFVERLDAVPMDAARMASCILAAEATFEAMERALRAPA